MNDEAVFAVKPGFIEAELGAEISLYDPGREQVTLLNETASDLWRLLDGTTRLGEVVGLLAQAYQVPANDIRSEIEAVVDTLEKAGLIEAAT